MEETLEVILKKIYTYTNQDFKVKLNDNFDDFIQRTIKSNIADIKIISKKPLSIKGNHGDNDNDSILNLKLNYSNYLVYDLIGHNGQWYITELDTIEAVENYILSESGILNMFTTCMIVIYEGEIIPYIIVDRESQKKIDVNLYDDLNKEDINIKWM